MIKIYFLIFCSFFMSRSWANEVVLSAGYSWTRTNLSGQNDLPLYEGNGISGELEYLIPINKENAVSIYLTFSKTSQENTANSMVIEKLKVDYLGAGFKYSMNSLFISASVGKVSFEDTITGTVNKKISADAMGYELGIGARFKMTRLLGFTVALQALHSSLDPSEGTGFYANYGLWQIRGMVGLTFILPSLPNNEFSLVSVAD